MKICILGGTGQLGYELSKDLEALGFHTVALGSKDLDIRDLDACYRILDHIKADFIIHAAAYTNIEGCEKAPDLAYKINVKGTENIVEVIEKIGGKFIYLSTDHVFSGDKEEPYREEDIPDPINVYGKSKYAGELVVQKNLKDYFIIRTSYIFGHRSKNFIKTIVNLSNNNTILRVTEDLKRSPTYSWDFSKALVHLLNSQAYGIYHLVNDGGCSWYEFVEYIFKVKKIDVRLVSVSFEEAEGIARRPKNLCLNNSSAIRLRPWKEAVEEYLKKI